MIFKNMTNSVELIENTIVLLNIRSVILMNLNFIVRALNRQSFEIFIYV
jgi:hypothetical protein